MVTAIIMGSRSVSLYAGTMRDRSIVPGSLREASGSGLFGDLKHRYFFSDECVMMGGGDQKVSAAYASVINPTSRTRITDTMVKESIIQYVIH